MTATDLTPTPGAPAGFPFEEGHVRHKVGWSRDEMRAERKRALVEGRDFALHKKRLYWSQEAVGRLFARVGQSPEKSAPARPGATADDSGALKKEVVKKTEPAPAAPETLRVVRCDLRNPHLLLACPTREDPDHPRTLLRVRVRDTKNFVRRMELPALRVDGYRDLYDLARALPRQKGKW